MKKKIVTVVGARPQFIKAATISRLLINHPKFTEVLIHTGQHFDPTMSDVFFNELNIPPPNYFLNINDCSHGEMTGRMLEKIEKTLRDEKPDAVLVYGDTNSTLAGALAAVKLHIPLVHVEAGLRSFKKTMPEEINRLLTDHSSSLLLCPTKEAIKNLAKEGITKGVHHIGDVMYDATLYANTLLQQVDKFTGNYALLTIHRAESMYSDIFNAIMQFVVRFATENDIKIIFPVHPRTKKLLADIPTDKYANIEYVAPLSYLETQACLRKAKYVLTDSGGLQKEAYFHRIPCITLRSETEWVETVAAGWNKLWTDIDFKPRKTIDEYGNGQAANAAIDKIIELIYT